MYKVYHAGTVDEAIEKGLKDLNLTENDIKIDVIEAGKRGIFGLGKKEAEVKLTVINPELKSYETIESLKSRETILEDEVNVAPVDTVVDSNVTEESFSEDEARDEVDAVTDEAIEVPTKVIEDETLTGDIPEDDINEEFVEDTVNPKITFEDAAESTTNYIHTVVTEMGIENKASYRTKDREINIELESEDAAKIIGKRGATLNAIQEIAQQYFNRIYTSYGRVIIDIENYREKREETLEALALNMTKKALRTELPVHLEPMPANERKIIHNVLSNVTNIKTYSEGEEPNRYLVIEKK